MATLATLRRAVQQKIGLDSTASGTEETLLDEWINEGVVQVLLRTRCNVNAATITLTADTEDYNIDTDILAINDIAYSSATDGTRGTLQRTTPEQIIYFRTSTPATTPRVAYYALNGNDLFMVYPTPQAADSLTVYYTPRPTAMSVTSHDPSNETYGGVPTEYHKAIEYYALWQAADYDDDTSSQVGEYYRVLFEQYLVQIRKQALRKSGRYLGPAVVGKRRSPVPSPSQYPQ